MIEYLTTQSINAKLENLLKNANQKIIIVSPYIKLHEDIQDILKSQKIAGIKIHFLFRRGDYNHVNLSEFSTHQFDVPKLHAKCYLNESEAIITSLNLHKFSQMNNREMGIYVKNEGVGQAIYEKALEDINLWGYKNPIIESEPGPIGGNDVNPVVGNTYSYKKLDEFFNFKDKHLNYGIKICENCSDIVLFSSSSPTSPYPFVNKAPFYDYSGEKTGEDASNSLRNNALRQALENGGDVHLFRDFVYLGRCVSAGESYWKNNKYLMFKLKAEI